MSSDVQSSVSKILYNYALTSNGDNSLRAFWDALPGFAQIKLSISFLEWLIFHQQSLEPPGKNTALGGLINGTSKNTEVVCSCRKEQVKSVMFC